MINERLRKYIGSNDITVVEAMQKIDVNTEGIIFIVDKEERLVGSLTDGDIRRWLIRTGKLDGKAFQMMSKNPRFLLESEEHRSFELMKKEQITSVPILDSDKRIINIIFDSFRNESKSECVRSLQGTPVIVMAGGKGTRLYPYTKILPKPLIPIGDIPILERILNRFNKYGAEDFYLTVNYRKEMIKSYFKELNPEYRIHYVEEEQPLGTAGSIKLIEEEFGMPVIITNCDTLIDVDYGKVLQFHKESENALTIVSALKNITIPYGVLHAQKHGEVISIEEKPKLSYFVNTGMYIIDPEYISKIPDHTFYHMTHLTDQLMEDGLKVGMYPVSENAFLDMGEFEEMKKMEERIKSGSLD